MTQQTRSQKGSTKKILAAAKSVTIEPEEKSQQEQQERHQMIAEAAYRIAEQRSFQGDMAMDDWLQAEAEVNARFEAKH